MPDGPPSPERRRLLGSLAAATGAVLFARAADTPLIGPCFPGQTIREKPPRGAFRFLVVNDLHHDGPHCDSFLSELILDMTLRHEVAFCLVVGDLADRGAPESLAAVARAFAESGLQAYPVPGNHDNDVAGDTSLYAHAFPGRVNYHFAHGGWQFVGLDSTEGYKWGDTHISDATLAWLDRTVPQLDRRAPTVVFTHFPLGEGVRMRPLNADAVLQRLAPLNLRVAFSGHFHARTERRHGRATLVTNVCCSPVRSNHDGTRAEGYLLCTAHRNGRLTQQFVEFVPATERPGHPA